MIELKGKYNTAKVFTDNVEKTAQGQIIELCNQEFVTNSKIRIMSDCHAGAGCTIGTTMTIQDKIVPNLVGVDIGCGMQVVKLIQKKIDLKQVDTVIREYVPSGFNIRKYAHWNNRFINLKKLKCIDNINLDRARLSIGSLGGGNHFIEINVDKNDNLYLVVHSGSRYLGKQVAEYYQKQGYEVLTHNKKTIQNIINKFKFEGKQNEIEKTLNLLKTKKININKTLAYVEGKLFNDYLYDMNIVQKYASLNRKAIVSEILNNLGIYGVKSELETIHNYIDLDNMILRKGAISAQKGEKVIIPMNMRDGSLICVGKGNEDWNYSAPHGAGRLMSRLKAKEILSMDVFKDTMKDVYSTSVKQSTIDEAPMAYKPMQEIIDNIKDTVKIVDIIKPVYNFKA